MFTFPCMFNCYHHTNIQPCNETLMVFIFVCVLKRHYLYRQNVQWRSRRYSSRSSVARYSFGLQHRPQFPSRFYSQWIPSPLLVKDSKDGLKPRPAKLCQLETFNSFPLWVISSSWQDFPFVFYLSTNVA